MPCLPRRWYGCLGTRKVCAGRSPQSGTHVLLLMAPKHNTDLLYLKNVSVSILFHLLKSPNPNSSNLKKNGNHLIFVCVSKVNTKPRLLPIFLNGRGPEWGMEVSLCSEP